MADPYESLAWLTPPPADFRARVRELAASEAPDARAAMRLANHALDENQLARLVPLVEKLRAAGPPAPLVPFTLGLAGNATLKPLVPVLVGTALREGIALECVAADFGAPLQAALDPASAVNAAKPDAVLLAIDHRGLPLHGALGDDAAQAAAVADALAFVRALRDGFREHGGAPSIVQTIAVQPESLFGSYERRASGTQRSRADAFNTALGASLPGTQDALLDVAALAESVGTARWFDPTQWNVGKIPFDARFLPLYADRVVRVIAALRGKSRRCLILDCDNTLWGGVIGDDGLEGIVVGQGDATGEAFLDVQAAALSLRERGVVLAVSSKNDDAVARRAFTDHPEMLLREKHIAVFQANWNDKATNIKAIASELALGVDAMVFLDDNPVERGLVRELLPEVSVPELPADPALYARTLLAAGYFEAVVFSEEDRARAEFYQDNAKRVALQAAVGDLQSYLASLNMTISFRPFDAAGRARIAQLIGKSNQFNLTTRRYDELDVAALEANPAVFTLQVRLVDAFGDNGMIGVNVCRTRDAATWEIDTWLMSCRVLGRGVERMVLRELLAHARAAGVERLVGVYVPSARNAMVRDHYAKLGFDELANDGGGRTEWVLATSAEIDPAPMTVDRAGFDALVSA